MVRSLQLPRNNTQ